MTGDRTANEISELEFELTDPAYFFVGLSGDQSCRVRLEERLRLADGTLREFFTARDCEVDAIRERASRTDVIDSARILSQEGETTVFQVGISGPCIVEAIEAAGALPQSVHATDGTGHLTAQAPRSVDSTAVIDEVLDRHPALELVARRRRDAPSPTFTPRGLQGLVRHRLTDRQWEVLRTAWREGYFERPREHTGEEIGEMLGISSATFSQHLRSAQRHLLSILASGEGRTDRTGDGGA